METPSLTTLVYDVKLNTANSNIMTVYLDIYNSQDKLIDVISVPIDIAYMGISWNGEFEMELWKDFDREINKYFKRDNKLPTTQILKALIERHYYGMI